MTKLQILREATIQLVSFGYCDLAFCLGIEI
jgi:hypothetical protein